MTVNDKPTSLRDLVDAAFARHQGSGRALASEAQRHGFQVTHATINAIKAGTYKSIPGDGTIRALAWLAGVSEAEAFTAAGRRVPGPPLADELPAGVDNLSPKARRAVIDLLRVLVDAEESDGRGNAAPMNQPAGDPGGNTTTTNHPHPDTSTPTDDLATRRATRERAGVGEAVGVGDGPAVSSAGFADLGDGFDEHGIPRPPAGLAAYGIETEGMRLRDALDAAGEESQDPEGES